MQEAVVGTYTDTDAAVDGDPNWWILLVTGSLWVIFALVVFQFDYTTVSALSILLALLALADIYHGEADLSLEWHILQAAFGVMIAFHVAAFAALIVSRNQ